MKILIHGRKSGYTVLFPRPTPPEFYSYASDIQSISANNYDVYYGKKFYTLAFVDDGCVFTKYIIGEDVERGQLGEIGISVFVPNTQKLKGADVKTLLDELINTYAINYITINRIEEPKNGFDWSLFTSLANDFDSKLQSRSPDNDNVTPGTQDPAYHYFRSDSELMEFLDKPFQEEYSGYRQILLIDSNLQGVSNPLNVLRNSGVEVNPDLKNEYYYLNNYKYFKGLSIIADGKPRSEEKHYNRIRAKWQVEIRYTKDYHEPIVATGTIINRDSDIHKYLEVKGNNIIINYDALKPVPVTKKIVFDVVTKKDGVKVTDAEIQIDSQPSQNIPDYTFSGEELGREHKIAARKGDNLISDLVRIIPQNCSEPSILLQLVEKRVVKIKAKDMENGDYISHFRVHITGKGINDFTDKIDFLDDEIYKDWYIQIHSMREYDDSEYRKFCPARDEDEIIFTLTRSKRLPIIPDPYGHGWHQPGSDQPGKPKIYGRKAKTIFSKPAVVAGSIVSALVFLFAILALFKIFGNENGEALCTTQRITEYVNGNTLHPDTLDQIADSIYAILSQIEQKSTGLTQEPEKAENNPIPNNDTPAKSGQTRDQIIQQEIKTGTSPVQRETVPSGKISEIENYLKGGEVAYDRLMLYLQDSGINDKRIEASIELYLKLWELDGSRNNTYWSYKKELQNDDILKNSKLMEFVDSECNKKDNQIKYVSKLSDQDKKTLSQIIEMQ